MKKNFLITKQVILPTSFGILLIPLSQLISSLVYLLPLPKEITSILFGIVYIIISYSSIKLYCNKILYISPNSCYINKPKIYIKWLIVGILLPIIVSFVFLSSSGELIKNTMNTRGFINIILTAIFILGFSTGVVEEMIFRGLIMKVFEKQWGKTISIIVPSIIFSVLHIIGHNLNIIDIILLCIAGTTVGIMFSLIVYESNSIWASAIVHGLWNIIIIGNILSISTTHNKNAIFSYKLSSTFQFFTGGSFGIEASIISVLGYIAVIIFSLYSIKKKYKLTQKILEK
ncbi:CAAX amino protease [Tepiditoga spiralis]|uniref:CAAX amino protease n=1 Tax=Tepiditoga spiralis TaxID=2108365 RepID=A0A7G1G4N8_9BACT|nr:type II CAAX endopeptidase family protein [Tepiditoga spiralis]BBE31490.1 CAAX amino protease [Tepiditoga spiralis]